MRLLLLGKNGQLGWELQRTLATLGEVAAYDIPEIDLTDLGGLSRLVEEIHPQVVVNAAAYTAVDRAEDEPQMAKAVNATAPGVLAEAARQSDAAFIHYSTDYVFDGSKGEAYSETDAPCPINVYGRSKLEGERATEQAGGAYLILRTSWVFSTRRDSFVSKVLQWSRQKPELRVVTDQVGSPTWARMLAEITAQVIAKAGENPAGWIAERRGIYHLAGRGAASRFEWAEAILGFDPHPEEQRAKSIQPALTSEFPMPARRPLYSALDCSKFTRVFGLQLPLWRDGLRMAMEGVI